MTLNYSSCTLDSVDSDSWVLVRKWLHCEMTCIFIQRHIGVGNLSADILFRRLSQCLHIVRLLFRSAVTIYHHRLILVSPCDRNVDRNREYTEMILTTIIWKMRRLSHTNIVLQVVLNWVIFWTEYRALHRNSCCFNPVWLFWILKWIWMNPCQYGTISKTVKDMQQYKGSTWTLIKIRWNKVYV